MSRGGNGPNKRRFAQQREQARRDRAKPKIPLVRLTRLKQIQEQKSLEWELRMRDYEQLGGDMDNPPTNLPQLRKAVKVLK